MQSTLAKNGVIETPFGASIRISYPSKNGSSKAANITKCGANYIAAFDEDDVDFCIHVNNKNNDVRGLRLGLTLNNEHYGFVVVPRNGFICFKSLDLNRGLFHFVCQTAEAGKILLDEMANKLSTSTDRSAHLVSIIKFEIDYSVEEVQLLVRIPIQCYSGDTIESVEQKIEEMHGIPFESVVVARRALENTWTLSDCNIQNGSNLDLVPRFGGAPCTRCRQNAMNTETKGEEMDPRGLPAFGRQTEQPFGETRFVRDADIKIEPFVVELRLVK